MARIDAAGRKIHKRRRRAVRLCGGPGRLCGGRQEGLDLADKKTALGPAFHKPFGNQLAVRTFHGGNADAQMLCQAALAGQLGMGGQRACTDLLL